MPDISRLVLEIDSRGVVKATGDLDVFSKTGQKAGKNTDDLANKMGALQLVVGKLPGPLKSIASGLMGIISPAMAVISAILEIVSAFKKLATEGVKAFQEQEIQLARLSAVLNATGAKAWTTTKKLQNLANSLQESTGRSSDEILQMQSVLLGYTDIVGENFERLTKNIIDMADVMGGSLVSSANTFGKAMDYPSESISALTRYGFKFNEEQRRLIKTLEESGDLAGAQVVILESMEKAFEGSAEATRDAVKTLRDYELAKERLSKAIGEDVENDPLVKWWRQVKTDTLGAIAALYEYNNQKRELHKAYLAVESGTATNDQELIDTRRRIKYYEDYIEKYEGWKNKSFLSIFVNDDYLEQANNRLLDLIEHEKLIRGIIEEDEATEKELYRLEKNREGRDSKIANILTQYENTGEGKAFELERKINNLLKLKEQLWEVDTGVFEGLSDEHKRQIDVIISDLRNAKNNARQELTDWQKIFKSAMNLSDTDIRQDWFKTQSTSITEFTKMLSTANNRARVLFDTLGTDITNTLEKAAKSWEDIASDMIMTGMWQVDTELFQQVVEYAREAREFLNETNFDQYIDSLNDELKMLKMTSTEMERQKLISEHKVINEEKITEALRLQNKLRSEQQRLNTISRITGISEEEIRGRTLDYTAFLTSLNAEGIQFDLKREKELGLINFNEFASGLGEVADNLLNIYREFNLRRTEIDTGEVKLVRGEERYSDDGLLDMTDYKRVNLFDEFMENLLSSWEAASKKATTAQFNNLFLSMIEEQDDVLRSVDDRLHNKVKNLLKDNGIQDPTEAQINSIIGQSGLNYLADLSKQIGKASQKTYDHSVERLMIEHNISREVAKQAVSMQKHIDYITNGHDFMRDIMEQIDDALRSIRAGEGGYGQYMGGRFAQAGMGLIEGTDVGNFVNGFQQGGFLVGIIETFVGALANAVGGMEGLAAILNPITDLMMELSDVFKAILLPVLVLSKALVELGKGINWLLDKITGGLISEMAEAYDLIVGTNNERAREEERLKALNDQYAKLYNALKTQEEYYLQKRQSLNAEWAIENYQRVTPVNDMILSPHGAFSTNPRDYIIATKNPEALMSGGVAPVYVNVINSSNASVSVQERTNADGIREMQILVEGLVQNGIASGKFDDVLGTVSQRKAGRRVSA